MPAEVPASMRKKLCVVMNPKNIRQLLHSQDSSGRRLRRARKELSRRPPRCPMTIAACEEVVARGFRPAADRRRILRRGLR